MTAEFPAYLAGLRLAGRRVLVVGGGSVAQRRVAGLLGAGAQIRLVAPEVSASLEGNREIEWLPQRFCPEHLEGAWYAVAATDDPEVNAEVVRLAEAQRIFCVRADQGRAGTAVTPATGQSHGLGIGVLAGGDPARSARVRDAILHALESGTLDARHISSRQPADGRGIVTLVGAGPGHPDLVTAGASAALAEADVVVADRLVPASLLARLGDEVELIDVAKLPRGRSARQEKINEVLIEHARSGKRVVRLKGGDNFVFGRGFEELQACAAAGIDVKVIPGVSSSLSVPALAGIPLTHRGVAHDFTVISGHLPPGHPDSLVEWAAAARLRGTLVILMGVENIGAIAAELIGQGRAADTPAAAIESGGLPHQRVLRTTLGGLAAAVAEQDVRPPAVMVVGPVAGLR